MKLKVSEHKMTLLPPREDVCQICAVKHQADQPHNAQSLYYQMKFQMENGRGAKWNDALAHCSEEVKAIWWSCLAEKGITPENGRVNPQ